MPMREIPVYFYGSYMNRKVLAEVGLAPVRWEPALITGFDIRIAPRANLVFGARDVVYGVLATATHGELQRLYAHAEHVLGEVYLPQAVVAHTEHGTSVAALCYIAHDMVPRRADPSYVDRILEPARELGFPAWYLAKLASFAG